jgi:hypothetical protein
LRKEPRVGRELLWESYQVANNLRRSGISIALKIVAGLFLQHPLLYVGLQGPALQHTPWRLSEIEEGLGSHTCISNPLFIQLFIHLFTGIYLFTYLHYDIILITYPKNSLLFLCVIKENYSNRNESRWPLNAAILA